MVRDDSLSLLGEVDTIYSQQTSSWNSMPWWRKLKPSCQHHLYSHAFICRMRMCLPGPLPSTRRIHKNTTCVPNSFTLVPSLLPSVGFCLPSAVSNRWQENTNNKGRSGSSLGGQVTLCDRWSNTAVCLLLRACLPCASHI